MMEALYTETVASRFELTCWTEPDTRGVLVQVLDLEPRSPDTECRVVTVHFHSSERAVVLTDHSGHRVERRGRWWSCTCEAAEHNSSRCYHRMAADAALRYCEGRIRERRRLPAAALYPAVPALGARA